MWRAAALRATSKYHHRKTNANAILENAVAAAGKLQYSWLSMPRITAATNSPRRMMVNNPNRSGKCVAAGGNFMLCRVASDGVAKSTKSASDQTQYRWGGAKNGAAIHIKAAAPNPSAYRVVSSLVS